MHVRVISAILDALMGKINIIKLDLQSLYTQKGELMFKELYQMELEGFVLWAQKSFGCPRPLATEVFHDSLTIIYTKVDRGEVTTIASSLKTYLFGIGKNLLLRKYKKAKRTTSLDEIPEIVLKPNEIEVNTAQHDKIRHELNKLNEGCRKLLELFYYKNYVIDAIAERMGYDSLDVVRTKKYKCLQQLKRRLSKLNPEA